MSTQHALILKEQAANLKKIPYLPGRWPILGHLPVFYSDLPRVFRSLRSERGALQRQYVPGLGETYVWGDTKAFDLFQNKITTSRKLAEQSEVIVGHNSMISKDGKEHRNQRKAAGKPFTPKGLSMSGVSDVMEKVIKRRMDELTQRSTLNVLEETQHIALEIIFSVMGIPQEQLKEWATQYNNLLKYGFIGPKVNLPFFPYRKAKLAKDWLDSRLIQYIQAARSNPESTGLIAELVRGRDESGQQMEDEALLDNLRLMVLAGHETTASVMAWMVAHANNDDAIWAALSEEANNCETLPKTPKDVSSYPFAEALFREALRIHPPASLLSRELLEDTTIEGHTLPAGTMVGIPIWLLSRDPSLFEDPETFNPWRWMGDRKKPSPVETATFGGGPHFCLGYHMAWVESVMFILSWAKSLNKKKLRPTFSRPMPRETYFPLLRPKGKDTQCQLLSL